MPNTPPLPFPHSYWVIPGKLMAGYYPGHVESEKAHLQLQALYDCGIRHFINLMEEDERNYQGQLFNPYVEDFRAIAVKRGETVSFSRYPIRDGGLPSPDTMRAILDEIDAELAAGKAVYVHCWGGKGRTGTVVGCYLARHGTPPETILDRIIELRKGIQPYAESPENNAQRQFVLNWKE